MSGGRPSKLADLLAFDEKVLRTGTADLGYTQLRIFEPSTKTVIGVDEVGVGCLAGPVVAAAVVMPSVADGSELASNLAALNDSKQLSSKQRERLAKVIHDFGWCAIETASVDEINQINIHQASLLAMQRAVLRLVSVLPDAGGTVVLVDGRKPLTGISQQQIPILQGDCKSAAIAAASIIAKVYRDALMMELSDKFPAYAWQQNKGYPTKSHLLAIAQNGVTTWHRRSFVRNMPIVQTSAN